MRAVIQSLVVYPDRRGLWPRVAAASRSTSLFTLDIWQYSVLHVAFAVGYWAHIVLMVSDASMDWHSAQCTTHIESLVTAPLWHNLFVCVSFDPQILPYIIEEQSDMFQQWEAHTLQSVAFLFTLWSMQNSQTNDIMKYNTKVMSASTWVTF